MQDNIAYNTVELSNVAPCENVYEIPGTSKMDQKQIETTVCNSRIQVRCFGLAIVFAIFFFFFFFIEILHKARTQK